MHRRQWHQRSLEAMAPAQVVFYDPDNGLEIKSVTATSSSAGKFALFEEVKRQHDEGKSLIVYHHGPLWFKQGAEQPYLDDLHDRLLKTCGRASTVACLRWNTTARRFYFLLIRPEHAEALGGCLRTLTTGHWERHLTQVI